MDRVYLKFKIDRSIRIIVISFLFSLFSILTKLLHNNSILLVVGVMGFIAVITGLRAIVTTRRVEAGRFGTNEYEARELLKFIEKIYKEPHKGFDPPGGMKRFDEPLEESIVIPAGTRYAS